MENKQTAKGYFEQFDLQNKGYVSLKDFMKVLLGPYRVMIMPEDLWKLALQYEIIGSTKGIENKDDDSFTQFKYDIQNDDNLIWIDYKNFMKQVIWPTIYQLAKDYTAVPIISVLKILYE